MPLSIADRPAVPLHSKITLSKVNQLQIKYDLVLVARGMVRVEEFAPATTKTNVVHPAIVRIRHPHSSHRRTGNFEKQAGTGCGRDIIGHGISVVPLCRDLRSEHYAISGIKVIVV
jgi:hypothetical protein